MSLKVVKPIVSVDWLYQHLEDKNLLILDCTIPKVTAKSISKVDKEQIKNAVFFDMKNNFSDVLAPYPNTVLTAEKFQAKAQDLGINKNSCIVVYDDLGIYSSPRVWWMFQLMGFTNVAVLNGGLPKWKEKKYPTEKPKNQQLPKGDFVVEYHPKKLKYTEDVLQAISNKNVLIVDARSSGRFFATEPEPRADLQGGHIPNSKSLPFSKILSNKIIKSESELKSIFNAINPDDKQFIFTCGSGITASILALGAEIAGYKNYAVYDGSWTEWGSTKNLPIEK